MELDEVSESEVVRAVNKLNSRPRKCLNYRTPYEVFKELTGMDAKQAMGYAFIRLSSGYVLVSPMNRNLI
jgi:hypothetical protein